MKVKVVLWFFLMLVPASMEGPFAAAEDRPAELSGGGEFGLSKGVATTPQIQKLLTTAKGKSKSEIETLFGKPEVIGTEFYPWKRSDKNACYWLKFFDKLSVRVILENGVCSEVCVLSEEQHRDFLRSKVERFSNAIGRNLQFVQKLDCDFIEERKSSEKTALVYSLGNRAAYKLDFEHGECVSKNMYIYYFDN